MIGPVCSFVGWLVGWLVRSFVTSLVPTEVALSESEHFLV